MSEEMMRVGSAEADASLDRRIDQMKPSPDSRRYMRIVAAIAAICGGLYGYDTGIISGALLLITREFHLSSTQQELVASAILAGAVIGALVSGRLSLQYGRRTTVKIVTAVFVAGAVACSLAPSVEALIAARVFLGFAVGGATQVVPMYISELAPAGKRGNMVTVAKPEGFAPGSTSPSASASCSPTSWASC